MIAADNQISQYGAPFWAGCDDGELLVQYCANCDRRSYPPEPVCPGCLGESLTWIPSKPVGTVYSFSVVRRSPGPAFEVPYVLAVIDMDDGWSLVSNIVGDEVTGPKFESVRSGARVRAEFVARSDGQGSMPVFRLTPAGACS